jgi:hypothetical protein
MSEEVKGMKTPDVGARIGELLEVPIPDIFLASWTRTGILKQLVEESRTTPDAITNLELSDHMIKSQHRPHIEIKGRNTAVKKIEFTLRLLFNLKGFSIRIQDGAITEMKSGPCEMQGTLEYQGLAVAEKKLAPIKLPETVSFARGAKVEAPKIPLEKTAESVVTEKPPAKRQALEPPKRSEAATKPRVSPGVEAPKLPPAESPKLAPPVKVNTIIGPATKPALTGPALEPLKEQLPERTPEPSPEHEEEEREQFVL